MKVLILAAYLIAGDTTLDGTDKMAHWGLSYMATDSMYELIKPEEEKFSWGAFMLSATGVFGAGLFKEFFIDSRPDGGDILANGIGTYGSVVLKIDF